MIPHHPLRHYEAWNSLSAEGRGKLLKQNLWGAYNVLMADLSPEEVAALQTHESFTNLRVAFTLCMAGGGKHKDVEKVTDLLADAIYRLRH